MFSGLAENELRFIPIFKMQQLCWLIEGRESLCTSGPNHPGSNRYVVLKRDGTYLRACCSIEDDTLVVHPSQTLIAQHGSGSITTPRLLVGLSRLPRLPPFGSMVTKTASICASKFESCNFITQRLLEALSS
jgi:hypothetical protein